MRIQSLLSISVDDRQANVDSVLRLAADRLPCPFETHRLPGHRVLHHATLVDHPELVDLECARLIESGLTVSTTHKAIHDSADFHSPGFAVIMPHTAVSAVQVSNRTPFDWDVGCDVCGSHARQCGSLRLTGSTNSIKAQLVEVTGGFVLIREKLAQRLTAVLGTDSFGQVVHPKGNEPIPYRQVLFDEQLPPIAAEARIGLFQDTRDRCPRCHRDGWYHMREAPFLPVVKVPARLKTYSMHEVFGSCGVSGEAAEHRVPHLVIPNRAVAELMKARVRGVSFVPVAESVGSLGPVGKYFAERTKLMAPEVSA